MKGNNKSQTKTLAIIISLMFVLSPVSIVDGLGPHDPIEDIETILDRFDSHDNANGINEFDSPYQNPDANYPENFDLGNILSNNDNTYKQTWDPWLTKAAIHAIATTDDGDMMALGGGYLYDNEIHLYRWNYIDNKYDLVWEIGDGIFQSDIFALEFADSDYNDLTEIIAGTSDGYIYVFEQRHIYDPITNMENQFDLVWQSPRLGRVFSLLVADTDGDYRQDIIVGTGDTVRWYEYDDHGNYPFTQDHWIEFEEVFSFQLPSQVTAMGITDVDSDGLPEVSTGTRSGEVHILENNGTSLPINGYLYPIMQDNSYTNIWSSGNIIRRPVSDISGGDLDNDGQAELLMAVQGQGAYVLDTIDNALGLYRLQRDFESWESNPIDIYPLDVYTDAMVNSSSLLNSTHYLPNSEFNVYWTNGTIWAEPLDYSLGNFEIFPYTSYSVKNQQVQPDARYTTFNAGIANSWGSAWAVYDWGNDEEAAGNGISSLHDVTMYVQATTLTPDQFKISVSQDNVNFFPVNASYVTPVGNSHYEIEVDPTLADARLDYYRYMKINVTSGTINVDVFETSSWNNPIYDALSTEIGSMVFKGDELPTPVGFIGTIDGAILGVTWDAVAQQYKITWDSWRDERYKLQTNLFDLEMVKKQGRFPTWINYGGQSFDFDLNNLPGGGIATSYTAENFYNYQAENDLEFIVSSSNGNLLAYSQTSPSSEPVFNQELTDMLFSTTALQSYVDGRRAAGINYFTVSLVPVDTILKLPGFGGVPANIHPFANAFWLFLGEWNGTLGNLGIGNGATPGIGEVDLSVWHLTVDETGSSCAPNNLPTCMFFEPLYDERSTSGAPYGDGLGRVASMELTGQMWGIMRSATWMPKIAGADFIGSAERDFVVTNGRIHLLESVYSQDPVLDIANIDVPFQQARAGGNQILQLSANPLFPIYQHFDFALKGGYFDKINENSKGRHWSNANPVDFDGDGDFDLILGFARYEETEFGISNPTFGMTYWENEGTRSDPIWVEKKKAVTNNDPDSNLRVALYSDPVLIYDDYNWGSSFFDIENGYHPIYKEELPTRLLMFQPDSQDDIFQGSVQAFYARYNQPTSILAATFPEAKRLDINLQFQTGGGDTEINYGFHIFETWNNREELNDWTLSLSTSDLDQDGKNEVVVGDFNNNIYVFEHLTNNTFKRAFRSFDVNRTIETNLSPYRHDLFGGISGTFYRTLFDHVEYLVAGYDLNGNGLQEFVAATESMIFIFEGRRTPTGLIWDDTYHLIGQIDLLIEPALQGLDWQDVKVTSLTLADDFTNDGRGELIVGVTNALLIYEIDTIPADISNHISMFSYEEIFFGDAARLLGLYDVEGNYYIKPNTVISAVLIEDLNNNGYQDMVIAGTDTTQPKPLWSGFVTVLEWIGESFRLLEEPATFERTTLYNPIFDLAVDDSDYDGLKELIIGHKNGIDIYENTVSGLVQREVITSNPHYMLPERYYYAPGPLLNEHKDIVRNPSGRLEMVYIEVGGLVKAYSWDDGETWIREGFISYTVTSDLGLGSSTSYTFAGAEEPSLVYDGNDIWLSFVVRYRGVDFLQDAILAYVMKNPVVGPLQTAYYTDFSVVGRDQERNMSPRVFNIFGNFDSNQIGLSYFKHHTGQLLFSVVDVTDNSGTSIQYSWNMPWANGSVIGNHFNVHSLDMVQLDNSRDYAFVLSGHPYNESLSMDLDLFYVPMYLNDTGTLTFNYTEPIRMDDSGLPAAFPSIIQEEYSGNMMVTFEQPTLRPYGGLFAMWSNDNGLTWNGPYDMSHPLGLDMPLLFQAYPTNSGESYRVGTTIGPKFITLFESRRPVIAPGATSGFTMVYSVFLAFESFDTGVGVCGNNNGRIAEASNYVDNKCNPITVVTMLASAINAWSNFTWFNLGSADKVVVGDSDRDGRHEILAASGNQAFLYEFASNSETNIHHTQVWMSPEYERQITDIAISDANGNGLAELIIESERGIVNAFEVTDSLMGQSNVLYPILEGKVTEGHDGSLSDNRVDTIVTADVNQDGTEDFIYSTQYGDLVAINGLDLSTIYHSVLPYRNEGETVISVPIVDLQILHDTTNGLPEILVFVHKENVTIFDLNNGNQLNHLQLGSSSNDITALTTGDLLDGGFEEIVIGMEDGNVYALDAFLATIWTETYGVSKLDPYIRDVEISNYANATNVAVTTTQGDIALLGANNGSIIWDTQQAAFTAYSGLTTLDINGDGLSDILAGDNFTVALNGIDGSQLWNASNPAWKEISGEAVLPYGISPQVYSINGDETDDVIFTALNDLGQTSVFAMDGLNGELIWTYKTRGAITRLQVVSIVSSLEFDKSFDVLLGYSSDFLEEESFAFILDPLTGISLGAIPSVGFATGIGISNLGYDRPVILVGDNNGNVTVSSIWMGPPDVPTPPSIEPDVIPFIKLGDEFTRRTQYLLHDINADGIDDVFVVDDDFIGVADTRRLIEDAEFNEAEWAHDVPEFGRLAGPVKIGEIDGDAGAEIVAVFEFAFTAINVEDGSFLWNFTYYDDDFLRPRNFNFEFVDIDGVAGDGDEILYSRELINSTIQYTEVAWLRGETADIGASVGIPYWGDPVVRIADINGGNDVEIIITLLFEPIPLFTYFAVLESDMTVLDWELFGGLPPVTDIAIGDFESSDAFDEFLLFFEFSALPLPAFIFELFDFPTLFIQFDWNDGLSDIILPATFTNVIGISPIAAPTIKHQVSVAANGDVFLIGQARGGDLFSFNFAEPNQALPALMEPTGVLPNIAVPYAKNTFLTGDFCGISNLVVITAANSLACYSEFDFTNPVPIFGLTIDFSVIQDIVPADLDDHDATPDLLISSFDGYVWLLRSEDQLLLALNAFDKELVDDELSTVEKVIKNPIALTGILTIFIGIPVLFARYKTKLRT